MSREAIHIPVLVLLLAVAGCRGNESRIKQAKLHLQNSEYTLAEAELAPVISARSNPVDSLLLMYGEILFHRGKLQQAKSIFLKMPGKSDYLNDRLGITYLHLGELNSARNYAEVLLHSDVWAKSRGYHLLGRIGFVEGKYDSAYLWLNQSLDFANQTDDPVAKADALRQLGVIDWYQGRLDQAHERYAESMKWYDEAGDLFGKATSTSNIGLLYWEKQQYGQYIGYQLDAFEMFRKMGNLRGLADSYYFLSRVPFNDFNHPAFTFNYLEKSLDISRQINYKWGEEVARQAILVYNIDLAGRLDMQPVIDQKYFEAAGAAEIRIQQEFRRLYLVDGTEVSPDSLITAFTKLAEQAEKLELANVQNVIYSRLIQLGIAHGRPEITESALESMRKVFSNKDFGVFELALPVKELQYESTKGWTEAGEQKMAELADRVDAFYLDQFAINPMISRELLVGNVQVLRSLIYDLNKKAAISRNDAEKFFTFLQRENVLPLLQSADPDDPVAQSVQQVVHQMEGIKGDPDFVKMQDFYSMIAHIYQVQAAETVLNKVPEIPGISLDDVVPLTEFQKVLFPEEVFLFYHIGDSSSFVLSVGANTWAIHELGFPKKILYRKVNFFRDALLRGRKNQDDTSWERPAQQLYSMLLGPVIDSSILEGRKSVHIFGSGEIRKIPFPSLVAESGNSGRMFLAQQWKTTQVHNISSFYKSRMNPHKSLDRLLAFAPESDNLPGTERELTNLERYPFGQSAFFRDRQAVSSMFLKNFEKYDLIHFAGHSKVVPGFPLQSYLQFYDEKLPVYKLGNLEGDLRLLVLSACETGMGSGLGVSSSTGFDYTGFVQHFHKIGVNSILSTLWPVYDRETTEWMEAFYAHLLNRNQNRYLAESVQEAQITFIEQGYHPFYWAGFTLSGDSR